MANPKEKHKAITDGYFYACCPYCKTTLTQGKNGLLYKVSAFVLLFGVARR